MRFGLGRVILLRLWNAIFLKRYNMRFALSLSFVFTLTILTTQFTYGASSEVLSLSDPSLAQQFMEYITPKGCAAPTYKLRDATVAAMNFDTSLTDVQRQARIMLLDSVKMEFRQPIELRLVAAQKTTTQNATMIQRVLVLWNRGVTADQKDRTMKFDQMISYVDVSATDCEFKGIGGTSCRMVETLTTLRHDDLAVAKSMCSIAE